MKVIVFLAILGLTLAGFRVDKKKVVHSIPHHHEVIKFSGHENSNSENSEELFNLLGSIEGGISNAVTGIQDTVQAVSSIAQGTASTVNQNLPGFINNSTNAIEYAAQNFNTTQALQDVGEGVALAGTIFKTTEGVLKIIDGAVGFVNVQGLAQDSNTTTAAAPAAATQSTTTNTASNPIQSTLDNVVDAVSSVGNIVGNLIQGVNETEVIQDANGVATAIGYGLQIANQGLTLANEVIGIVGAFA